MALIPAPGPFKAALTFPGGSSCYFLESGYL